MDTESTAVAAEIEATQGALEADALEARVETADLVREVMRETVQVDGQEVKAPPAPPLAPIEAKPEVKPEAKAAPAPKPEAKQGPPIEAEVERKTEARVAPAEDKPAPKEARGEQKHELTTSAFKALKAKAEEKGKRQAMDEITKAVQEAGYANLGEALKAIKDAQTNSLAAQIRQNPAPSAPQALSPALQAASAGAPAPAAAPVAEAPKPANDGRLEAELRKAQRERERLAAELQAARAQAEQEAKRRKQMTKKMEAMAVDQELREVAIQTGVKDVDYAMNLLQRDLATKTDDQLASFSEAEYFKGLRDSHGYLFGEKQELAHTGNPAGTEPAPPPTSRQTQQQVANGAKKDALKMTPTDLQSRLKELGLTLPTS